jgi:Ca2+-binding RTX toxin-like protein
MSVIKVQATRVSKTNSKPEGREKYQFENIIPNSKTPIQIGVLILAFTMYLKSVLVPQANASVPPEHDRTPHDQPGNSDNHYLAREDFKDVIENSDSSKAPSASRYPSSFLPGHHNYAPDETDPYNFYLAQLPSFRRDQSSYIVNNEPVSFSVLPSNDNNLTSGSGAGGNSVDNGNTSTLTPTTQPPTTRQPPILPPPTPSPTPNRRPIVAQPVVLYDQFACVAVMIAVSDLLRDASDLDGDKLQIRNVKVSSGELVLTSDGYRFHSEQIGPVTITYEISDGRLSVLQTARFNLLERPAIIGTDGDDNLLGTDCEDNISGGAGNDQIDGRDGDDNIVGGDGDDHIVGGSGNDVIFGGYGNDIIFGGAGDDTLSGGGGNDRLFGGAGNDVLLGGADNDTLFGNEGNDVLLGEDGNDLIYDGTGSDSVDGGKNNDTVVASADSANDLFDGGLGIDSIDYSASKTAITFNLSVGRVTGQDIGSDQVANVEKYIGGAADDTFIADVQVATLPTEAVEETETASPEVPHDDQIETIAQPVETFIGGAGVDTLDYSAAQNEVTINIATGEATGADIGIDNFAGIEHFVGGNGNDNFIVGQGAVTLDGRSGNDVFEFLTATTLETVSPSSHHIVGFEEGDWIRMSKYEIFESAVNLLEDAFQDIYGNGSSGSGKSGTADEVIPIRIRHEVADSGQNTYIDADFDHNNVYEITVQLDGVHHLLILNNQIAS